MVGAPPSPAILLWTIFQGSVPALKVTSARKPWDIPTWKYKKQAHEVNMQKKPLILLFIAPVKIILPLAGSFCCHFLPCVYLWLLGGQGFSGDVISGEGMRKWV